MDLLIKQPQQPAIDRRTGDVSGDGSTEQPEESPLSAPPAAAAAPATVEPGDEAGSSSAGSQARAGDGKPAPLPNTLTDEGREVADRFRAKRAQPGCTDLELGLDLVDIFRNRRLPVHGDVVHHCDELLGLSRIQVRELVKLATEHLTQNGGRTCSPGTDIRPSGSNASQQPANPPEAAAGDDRSAAPASSPAPEKKRALTKKPKPAEAAPPQAGEPAEVLIQLPVTPAQSL